MYDRSFSEFARHYLKQIVAYLVVLAGLIVFRNSEAIAACDTHIFVGTLTLGVVAVANLHKLLATRWFDRIIDSITDRLKSLFSEYDHREAMIDEAINRG